MPCIHQHDHHRDKIATNGGGININKMFNTAVARPVARKEMMENEEARKAMRKEWLGQHAAGVYDFSVVREYDDVVRRQRGMALRYTWPGSMGSALKRTTSCLRKSQQEI